MPEERVQRREGMGCALYLGMEEREGKEWIDFDKRKDGRQENKGMG